MSRGAHRIATVLALVVITFLIPGVSRAGGPGVWTMLSNGIGNSGNEAGILRTSDGKLHVVWQRQNKDKSYTYGTSTIALNGQLLVTGSALPNWKFLEGDPRLVPNGTGMRLVFKGVKDNTAGFFSRGAVYTETSPNGSSWTLVNGTMAHHTVLNGGVAAAAETNGVPVAAFGLNETLFYHENVDSSSPAASADGSVSGQVNSGLLATALARDQSGSIWMAWYQRFQSKQGFWVDKILSVKGTPTKAPSSGNTSVDNQPGQQVAFAARPGGGLYMAYCSPTSTKPCAHILLWRVGSSTAKTVPDSSTGNAGSIALTAGKQGRLSVAWFDSVQNLIHVVRTNTTATAFGVDRKIKPPPHTFIFDTLQAEGTFGRVDLIANVLLTTTGNPIRFFHTQVLAGLTLTAKPSSFSHKSATTVTFTVTDAGQPVPGAKVLCLAKSATTNSSGVARITFPKGTPTGKHVATAKKPDYNPGKTTITVT